MTGSLHFFCGEWQRARRVLLLDAEAQYELARTLGPEGELDISCPVVTQYNLQCFKLDLASLDSPGFKQLQEAIANGTLSYYSPCSPNTYQEPTTPRGMSPTRRPRRAASRSPTVGAMQRSNSGRLTPMQRSNSGRLTPMQRSNSGRVTPVQRSNSGRLTPLQRSDSGRFTPVDDVAESPSRRSRRPTQEPVGFGDESPSRRNRRPTREPPVRGDESPDRRNRSRVPTKEFANVGTTEFPSTATTRPPTAEGERLQPGESSGRQSQASNRDRDPPTRQLSGEAQPGCMSTTSLSMRPPSPRRVANLRNVQPWSFTFINPDHPLSSLPAKLERDQFVSEMKQRLTMKRQFEKDGPHIAPLNDMVISVEDAEDLFESLMLLQFRGATSNGYLSVGKGLDEAVDSFYALCKFRRIAERGASSLKGFFGYLDLGGQEVLERHDMKHFLKNASDEDRAAVASALAAEGLDVNKLAQAFFSVLDANQNQRIELWELRRQVALAAPPRTSMLEMMGQFQIRHGYGKSGLPQREMDRSSLYNHMCNVELLDISPEVFSACFRLWTGVKGANLLARENLDNWLKMMPLGVGWGLEPHAADLFYEALGARALQIERKAKMDAGLPADCLFGGDDEEDADLRSRFEKLFDRYVSIGFLGIANPRPSLMSELKEACYQRYNARAEVAIEQRKIVNVNATIGNLGPLLCEADDRGAPSPTDGGAQPQAANELAPPTSPTPTQATAVRIARSPRNLARARNFQKGPRSLFPNIGDVVSVACTRLHAGQSCIIRYRLMGATNFWHPDHQVLKNEREVVAWPISRKVLGDTPFIGLVPRGLKWTSAGGGGFYLGNQPFSRVDPNLRADLPKDPASGLPLLFGTAEIVAPSLTRISRAWGSGLPALTDATREEFEVRLFCSRKHKIIACVGDPVLVQVYHQHRPPPLSTLQARCEGRCVTLRWAHLGSIAESEIECVRLYMKGSYKGHVENFYELAPDAMEFRLEELSHDTEYEVRARLENKIGAGNEAVTSFRTNQRCSVPHGVACIVSNTTEVQLRWHAPDVLGNEATKDRYQTRREQIECYHATLKVDDHSKQPARPQAVERERTSLTDGEVEEIELLEDGSQNVVGRDSLREIRWSRDTWDVRPDNSIICSLSGLRPDTHYGLWGLCAVNSTGAGHQSKTLQFCTIPQTPIISSVRVTHGEVLVALSQTGGANVKEWIVNIVHTKRPEKPATFTLQKAKLRAPPAGAEPGTPPELVLPFSQMPLAQQHETHAVTVKAHNSGGASEPSNEFQTHAVARQQGADQAQAALIEAMESREIEKLSFVLDEVRDIEFADGRYMQQATELLSVLTKASDELQKAMAARDPAWLAEALQKAEDVQLPHLEEAAELLQFIQAVLDTMNEARGIDPLKEALSAAMQAKLPDRLLEEANQRLKDRESAQQGLQEAMEIARVNVLVAALEKAMGMHLPSEREAEDFLMGLQDAESALLEALSTGLINDLDRALGKVQTSGLREDGLINEASTLLRELRKEQQAAEERLQKAMLGRHPVELEASLACAKKAQVPPEECRKGDELLAHIKGLLAEVQASRGVEEREVALKAAQASKVPQDLLDVAELQLLCLKNLLAALAGGSQPALRQTLKLADNAGVTNQELVEARSVFAEWTELCHEVEVAIGLAQTERLRRAIDRARSARINTTELQAAANKLEALEKRDRALQDLREAIDKRICEPLHAALREACNSEAMDLPLLKKAGTLLKRLWSFRLQLGDVVDKPTLTGLYDTLNAVREDPSLPQKELQMPEKLLEQARTDEYSTRLQELRRGVERGDFRTLDYAVNLAKKYERCGVWLDEEILEGSKIESKQFQDQLFRKLQDKINDDRHLRQKRVHEGDVPHPTERELLPLCTVSGEFHVPFKASGTLLCELPREILEGVISIPLPDKIHPEDKAGPNDLVAAENTCSAVQHTIQTLLNPEDNILREPEPFFLDDTVHLHRQIPFKVFVRSAVTNSLSLVQQLYEHTTLLGERDLDAVEAARGRPSMARVPQTTPTGGPMPLSRYLQSLRARFLRRVRVSTSWKMPKGITDSLEMSCVVFDNDRLLEIVDSIGPRGRNDGYVPFDVKNPAEGFDGCLGACSYGLDKHDEAARLGSTGMRVRLDLLPEQATDLVFTIQVRSTRDLAKFGSMTVDVYDDDTGSLFGTFSSGNAHAHHHPEALVLCSIYRLSDGLWRVNSLGTPCRGTSRDYRPLLNKLQALGYPRNLSMQHLVPAILVGMQGQLNLSYLPKATKVVVDDANMMTTSYTIETFERDQSPEELMESMKARTFQDAVDESLRSSGGDRFAHTKVELLPTTFAPLTQIRLLMTWEFPVEKPDSKSGKDDNHKLQNPNYLDTACFAFEGRQLQEVADYRGPHGVRIVHNGIIDYAGLWVGVTGVGDATGGAVTFTGEDLDMLPRAGMNTMEVDFTALPETTTDLYFVLSAPVLQDMSRYSAVQVVVNDAKNVGHEITHCQLHTEALVGLPAAVMCKISRTVGEQSWKFTPVRAGSKGTVHNYQELICFLRAMQEANHVTVPSWPYMDPNQMECRRQERKQMWSLQTHRMRQRLAELKGDTCAMDHDHRRNTAISINSSEVEDLYAINIRSVASLVGEDLDGKSDPDYSPEVYPT